MVTERFTIFDVQLMLITEQIEDSVQPYSFRFITDKIKFNLYVSKHIK